MWRERLELVSAAVADVTIFPNTGGALSRGDLSENAKNMVAKVAS